MLNGAIVTQGLTSSVCVCTVGVLIIPHMKVHLLFFLLSGYLSFLTLRLFRVASRPIIFIFPLLQMYIIVNLFSFLPMG